MVVVICPRFPTRERSRELFKVFSATGVVHIVAPKLDCCPQGRYAIALLDDEDTQVFDLESGELGAFWRRLRFPSSRVCNANARLQTRDCNDCRRGQPSLVPPYHPGG